MGHQYAAGEMVQVTDLREYWPSLPTEIAEAGLDALLARAAKAGDIERFKGAPRYAPRRRLDETKAAREPKLVWKDAVTGKQAAE